MGGDGERVDALRNKLGEGSIDFARAFGRHDHELVSERIRAACISAVSGLAFGLDGSTRNPNVAAFGTSSRSKSSRFDPSALTRKLTPVILPPGRARLVTSPILIGSAPTEKTMGIVVVAALAARAEAVS